MKDMEFHEAANIFPLDETHIGDLASDIESNGLRVPIETLGGKIIDGRRRWLACQKKGIKLLLREVTTDDPIAYVLSLNLHRRHLTPSQLTMVGARADALAEKLKAEASARMKAGKKNPMENFPQGTTRDQIGKLVGVSGKSIDYGTKVLQKGVPELIKAVDEGRMAVSTAAILASEPKDVQRAEATQPKRNRKYLAGPNGAVIKVKQKAEAELDPDTDPDARTSRGKGVRIAYNAINLLKSIPRNDALRKRGFQIVLEWVQRSLRKM